MARTIGEKPREAGLLKIWNFINRELPDYMYGVFDPIFEMEDRKIECDVALFIPHMGVFLMDAYLSMDMVVEDGKIYHMYGRRKVPFDPEKEKKKMLDRRFRIRQYMHNLYHFDPLVFEMTCYPLVEATEEIKNEMGKAMDLDHVLFSEDFENADEFLMKVFRENLKARRQTVGNYVYSEMMDEMAYLLYARWGVGLPDPERPERPPIIFLSYNRNDQIRAWEIKKEIESRGIFVWRAPEDVMVSDDYKKLETDAIIDCDAFLILLSSASMNSDEVLYEFETAKKYDKTIIPIIIEDVERTEYYRKNLSHIQYRHMVSNDANVFNEIAELIKAAKQKRISEENR